VSQPHSTAAWLRAFQPNRPPPGGGVPWTRRVPGTEPERLGGRASLAGRWRLITLIGSVASAAILVLVLAAPARRVPAALSGDPL
jgi:hypothetical protein